MYFFFKYFTQIERSAHLSGLLNCIFLVAVPTILVVSISYWWDFIWVSTYYLKLSISVSELNQEEHVWKFIVFGFIKMEYARYWCSFSFVFVFDLNWVKWYNNLTDRHVNGKFCRINSDACVLTNDKEGNFSMIYFHEFENFSNFQVIFWFLVSNEYIQFI